MKPRKPSMGWLSFGLSLGSALLAWAGLICGLLGVICGIVAIWINNKTEGDWGGTCAVFIVVAIVLAFALAIKEDA